MGMAKRFGEVFHLRMGVRNLVVVSSPELAKEVLHTQGVEFGSRTRNAVFDIFTGKGQDMVFTVYGDHWRKMRRIMTVPFFTSKVVAQNRVGWEEEARLVVEDVRADPASATTGVVIRRRLQLMMALNAERSILSQSFDYNYGDFIPLPPPLPPGYLNRCTNLKTKRMKVFEDEFVTPRKKALEQSGEIKCAMDHILEAERKGEINHDNVLYIVENINVAAIETTLWSIEWGIAELVNHPDVQSKLRNEIAAVLGPNVAVTEPDLERLPYLQSVVKETLRFRMAIPLLVPHMNLKEAKLAGYDIPAESKILVNAWFLANDPKRWVRSDEFRPERFLEEEKAVQAHGNHPSAAHHRHYSRKHGAELPATATAGAGQDRHHREARPVQQPDPHARQRRLQAAQGLVGRFLSGTHVRMHARCCGENDLFMLFAFCIFFSFVIS
ncbi:hypothetical protein ACQ4PT_053215 [Festuca glaucescens]